MNDEAQTLLNKYTAQMSAVMDAFRIEATALAWQIAARLVAESLPERVAVGTLSYGGKKTKMAIPAPRTKVIKGKGTIAARVRDLQAQVSKPERRADEYTNMLVGKRNGKWSRRGSTKVLYTCEGWKSVPKGAKPVFYLMKNQKTGKTITVKFDSIVRDWTYTNGGHDEMLRQAA